MNIQKWLEKESIPEVLFVEALHDDFEGFRVLLRGESKTDKMLKIEFEVHHGYRNVDESYRLKTLRLNPILQSNWSLFKTNDSNFIDWICEESESIELKENLTHYLIVSQNDIIEIVSEFSPIISCL